MSKRQTVAARTAAAREIARAAAELAPVSRQEAFLARVEAALECNSYTARLARLTALAPTGEIVTMPAYGSRPEVEALIVEANISHPAPGTQAGTTEISAAHIAAVDAELSANPWRGALVITDDGRPVVVKVYEARGELRFGAWIGAVQTFDRETLTAEVRPFAGTYTKAYGRTPAGIQEAREEAANLRAEREAIF